VGPAGFGVADGLRGLMTGLGTAGLIEREIRLPRMILSVEVGAMLGLAGAAMQGLLRNPLAEPAVFGAPQAAAFGAVVALYSGYANVFSYALPVAAIVCAAVSVGLVIVVAGRRAALLTLILSGLAIGTLATAATALAINLSPNPFAVTEIVFWLMGSFEDRSMRDVVLLTPFVVVGAALLLSGSRDYRALALGEETASSLGVNVRRLQFVTVIGVAIGVGAGVAVSGAIGFVGLVAPHLARAFVGGDPGRSLAPSAMIGAALLTAADIGVRLIPSNQEIQVGVLTALLGVPLFLWLLLSGRAQFDGGGS
jgi:iron complex transport system permease protein